MRAQTCETCAYWGKVYEADKLGRKDCCGIDSDDNTSINATTEEDRGILVILFTKPNFYCKLHKPKETQNEHKQN